MTDLIKSVSQFMPKDEGEDITLSYVENISKSSADIKIKFSPGCPVSLVEIKNRVTGLQNLAYCQIEPLREVAKASIVINGIAFNMTDSLSKIIGLPPSLPR